MTRPGVDPQRAHGRAVPRTDAEPVASFSRGADDRSASSRELARGVRLVLVVLSIALLSGVVPAGLIASIPSTPRSDGWVLTLLVIVWAGFRLSLLWVNGAPRLFDYFFWLFTYIFMGIAPTAQIRSGLTSTTTPGVDPGLDVPTAGVLVLGLACYEIGRIAWLFYRYRVPRETPPVTRVHSGRTIILLVVSLAVSAYFVLRVGVAGSLGSREGAQAARAAAWPDPSVRALFYAGAVYPLLVATGALAQLARTASSSSARRLALFAAFGGGVVLLLIVNPIASARYTFGTVLFALAVYLGAVATRRRARLTMLAGIVGFLLVFPIADAFRSDEVALSRAGFFDEYLSNPDYDAFWQIANALAYWIDGHVVALNQALGSLLFFVPRALWPTKPSDTGILLAEYRGYSFDNLSAPMWAEGLVNGGVFAVAVTFLVMGVILPAMDARILPAFGRGGAWAIVGAVFPVYMTILLRGSLLQATGALAISILCVLFVRDRSSDGPELSPARAEPASAGSPPAR